MKIDSTPQPLIPHKRPTSPLSEVKQFSNNQQDAAVNSPQPPLSTAQPDQIKRIVTVYQNQNPSQKSFVNPVEQYQSVEALEQRQELVSLVGLDVYA